MCRTLSTDAILERLAWIADRRRYRRACQITDNAAYAEECRAERELLSELNKRQKESPCISAN